MVALMFAVADFIQRCGIQPTNATLSCTDVASTWDRPRNVGKANERLDGIDHR